MTKTANKRIKIILKSKQSNKIIKELDVNEFLSYIATLDNMNLLSNNNNLLSDVITTNDVIYIIKHHKIKSLPKIINNLELNLRTAFYEEEFELFKNYDIEHY